MVSVTWVRCGAGAAALEDECLGMMLLPPLKDLGRGRGSKKSNLAPQETDTSLPLNFSHGTACV